MKRLLLLFWVIVAASLLAGFSDHRIFETAHFSIFWSGTIDRDGLDRLSGLLEEAYREYLPLFQEDPASRRPVDVVVFASTGDFCHHTGLPWWSASVMGDGAVYLQPVTILKERGILERVVAHETALVFIHTRYGDAVPPWYAEGLAMYLAGEDDAVMDALSGDRPEIFGVSDIDELLGNHDDRGENAWGYVLAYEEVSSLIDEHGLPAVAQEGERFFGDDAD